MIKKTGWSFALIALILGGCIYYITTGTFVLGIDLRGGTELTYGLDLSRVEAEGSVSAAEQIKSVVANRLDIYGLKEISIAVQGADRLVIQLPGTQDSLEVENLKKQVEEAGNLLFMLVAPPEEQTTEKIEECTKEEEEYVAADRAWFAAKRKFDDEYKIKKLDPPEYTVQRPKEPDFIARQEVDSKEVQGKTQLIEKTNQWGHRLTVLHNDESLKVSGSFLKDAAPTYDENGRPAVAFAFNPDGANRFANLTGPNKGRLLAISLDDRIRQVATIRSRISDRGELSGNFSQADVRSVVTILKGGSLPTKPRLISETTVGAVLGQDSIRNGTIAMVAGLIGVLGFMGVYYLVGGMVANFALVFNLIIILGYVMVFRQTLTFPGIAGMLLTLAMAVDANILIFERIREELARGKSLLHAMGAGYQRAFWVIFDSNITTILTGIVLFQFGTGPVKGFAVTLIAGLVASFFTAVFVTRVILSFMYNWGLLKRMPMLLVFHPPRVDYIAKRKVFVGITVGIIILTWAIFVIPRGNANFGIDFTGGAKITMNLSREIEVSEMRRLIDSLPDTDKLLFKDYSIQTLNAREGGRSSSFSILTRTEDFDSGIAQAQEPAPAAPAGAPAPAAQPAAVPEAPASQPAAPVPAAPAVPESAPAAPAAPEPAAPAAPAPAAATATNVAGSESTREGVLRSMLQRENLLLPEPFSAPEWQEESPPPGGQRLVMDVRIARFNESNDFWKNKSRADAMLDAMNTFLKTHPDDRIRGAEAPTAFQGIRVKSVAQPNPAENNFRITTNSYVAPLPSAGSSRDVPTHAEVEKRVKEWFRSNSQLVTVSEPIPEVLSVGRKVSSSLEQDAVIAIFISFIGIMFYMALRFEFMYGLAGVAALIHDVTITIGIMAMTDSILGDTFSLKINLGELAAFLTIIGFSINDTIVIFDRIREMLQTGKKKIEFGDLINAAVNQTLSRTIWTSLTTLLVTLALLLFGGEPVRGFSFAFAVGIITGCYSSVFIAGPIVLAMHNRQIRRREAMLRETAKA